MLQTASRDHALTKRAHNFVDVEDNDREILEDTVEGKKCTTWLADQAVEHANGELEQFRREMQELGYEDRINNHVKIGAYCPAMIADSALLFLDTPCEDRDHALTECLKGLSETCKYEKKAIKKMMENVKKLIKREFDAAKNIINQFPRGMRPEIPNINWDDLFRPVKDALDAMKCDDYKKLEVADLTSQIFADMKQKFKDGLSMLTTLQASQNANFQGLANQGQDVVNVVNGNNNVGNEIVQNVINNNNDVQNLIANDIQDIAGNVNVNQLENQVNQLQNQIQGANDIGDIQAALQGGGFNFPGLGR